MQPVSPGRSCRLCGVPPPTGARQVAAGVECAHRGVGRELARLDVGDGDGGLEWVHLGAHAARLRSPPPTQLLVTGAPVLIGSARSWVDIRTKGATNTVEPLRLSHRWEGIFIL